MSDMDVADLVTRFVRLRDAEFADTRFTESGGTIEVDCRHGAGRRFGRGTGIQSVTMIRFELPGTDYLHLASVVIEADGLDDPARQTSCAVSSVWKDYGPTLDSGVIFDPGHRDKAFHTRKESHPWLEITFDRPRDLTRLRIRNCEGANSLRARGISVSVQTSDGRRRTVYDGLARERELVAAAERLANRSATPAPRSVLERVAGAAKSLRTGRASSAIDPATPELARVLALIAVQDDSSVRWALARLGLSAEQSTDFRTAVNQELLFARQRELTSHGIRRSFRFWSDAQVQDYLDFALDVVGALRDLTPNVCFGFGSALAIFRDHRPIPHDDDMDLLIGFEPEQAATHTEARALVRDCLTAKGFKVTGGMTAYQWVTRSSGGTRLDVFLGVFEGDNISWYPGRRGALTRDMMFVPMTREFLGRDCPIPAQPEQYLQQIYGSGWVRPDPGFSHQWNPAQYADIAGS